MTSTRSNSFLRGVTWLLAAAFLCATLPAPAFAQDVPAPEMPVPDVPPPEAPAPDAIADQEAPPPEAAPAASPADAARERIRQLRAARAAGTSVAPETPGQISMEASTTADGEQVYSLNMKDA